MRLAVPVYGADIALICRSYARICDGESATRSLALTTHQRAVGRSAEVAWTTYDGIKWDSHFQHIFLEHHQPKGGKIKLVACGAGIDRHRDWFVKFGDYMVMQPDRQLYTERRAAWLFPRLQKTSSPGTTMGNFIKALLPADRGGADEYQHRRFVLPQLPPGITAGGVRPGGCNELNTAMPPHLATMNTGHDLRADGAYFNYVDATRAGCMPGSVVLGGWPKLPFGEMGMGPLPPSLAPLEDMGVSMDSLEEVMTDLFRIDGATDPMLWRDGHLRPMLRAAFASMLMYYDERAAAGEMTYVLSAMMDSLNEGGLSDGDARSTFSRWGEAIKIQFDLDNAHLTARKADTSSVQVVSALQGLGRMVGGLQRQVASLRLQLQQATAHSPATLNTPAACIDASIFERPSPARSPPKASPDRPSFPSEATPTAAASSPGSNILQDALQEPSPPPLPPPVNRLGPLLPMGGGSSPAVTTISGEKALHFYLERMLKGGALPALGNKQERPKAELCMKFFNAMATAEERTLLKPPPAVEGQPPPPKPDNGPRRVLASKLHGLVLARLIDAYQDASAAQTAKKEKAAATLAADPSNAAALAVAKAKSITTPRDFLKHDYLLPVSGISSHVEVLKLAVDSSIFQAWRMEYEKREPSPDGGGPAKKKARRK